MEQLLNTTWWITTANLLFLASYSVHDILWLRILTVAASLLLTPYYLLQPSPLWMPACWSLVFTAINAYWIVTIMLQRRPVVLTADERRLREIAFPSLTPNEALKLYKIGRWDDIDVGVSLVQHDRSHARFSVILSGHADVKLRGEAVAELGEGQFIGEIDALADKDADIDVLVRSRARVLCWPRDDLQLFLKDRPDVALALERSVGLQLRRLLDGALDRLSVDLAKDGKGS